MSFARNAVYGLMDPRDHVIYNVGQTTRGIKRPLEHGKKWCKDNPDTLIWIASMHAAGVTYEVIELEALHAHPKSSAEHVFWFDEGRNLTALNAVERKWIALLGRADLGTGVLTNRTGGGYGTPDLSPAAREQRSINGARAWSNEIYARETRARLKSPEHRKKMSDKLLVQREDPSFVENLRSSAKRNWEDPVYRFMMCVMHPRHILPEQHGGGTAYGYGCRCILCVTGKRQDTKSKRDAVRALKMYSPRKQRSKPVSVPKSCDGSTASYKRGCRCGDCRTAQRLSRRRTYGYGERVLAPCGTRAAYRRGCRCVACVTANKRYSRDKSRRSRSRTIR